MPRKRRLPKPRPTNKAWEEFVAWCQSRGLQAVPANPWTLAAFVRSCEGRYRPQTIRRLVAGIAKIHSEKTRKRLDRHPLVLRTLRMIENRAETRDQHGNLFDDEDFLPGGDETGVAARPAPKKKPTRKDRKTATARVSLSSTPRLISRRTLAR